MGYNVKDVFYLDSTVATGTVANDQVSSLDVSAYIDPIARGKSKAVGLAIYKVHWDLADAGANGPIPAASTGTFRVALSAGTGLPDGTVTVAAEQLNAGNALMVSGVDYWAGGTAAGDPPIYTWLEPSKDVPYIVVRDSLQLITSTDIAMSTDVNVFVRLECAQITLDQATLNQLLRTQTV